MPSGIAPACSGDQLELTCSVTANLLEWRINVTSVARIYIRGVSSDGPTINVQTNTLMINSSNITFSRISNENAVPLISRLFISYVGDGLNGTIVTCEDVVSSQSTSTIITVTQDSLEDLSMGRFNHSTLWQSSLCMDPYI